MVKSSNCFHSFFLFSAVLFSLASCSENDIIYQKEFSNTERSSLSESLLNGAGTDLYYQGSVGERMVIHEGNGYSQDNAWGQREIGVPYLKRGFAAEAYKYYSKAAELDPEEWLGYKAYCWLYFYRDYEQALEDIERYDEFTPDFVDYPQSTSVNYMRGICHLQLENYKEAAHYMSLHLEKEIQDVGPNYVESLPYIALGLSYHHQNLFEKADSIYSKGLEHNQNASDLHYYKVKNLLAMGLKDMAYKSYIKAQDWYSKGAKNTRPYVEEFFAIYQEDLNEMRLEF